MARSNDHSPKPIASESAACVWMRAGVLSYKLCDRDFDCEHCLLDAALHGGRPEAAPPPARGDWGPMGSRLFPHDRLFSPGHAWVLDAAVGSRRIGVDALVTWLVSDVVSVELPALGTRLVRGDLAATLVTNGGALRIAAPIAGRIKARNEVALGCPELVASAPYGAGWLIELEGTRPRQARQKAPLLCGPDMEKLSRAHLHDFYRRTDALLASRPATVGATLADGGRIDADLRAMLGSPRYLKLVQELLT